MYYDTRLRVARSGTSDIMINSHAYSRKYSRFARLRLLGFKTPYFRNVKNQVKIWLRQSDVMLRIVMLFAMLTVM